MTLIGLALYILAGANRVPFHGDESTILYTTRDMSYLLNNQMEHISYSDAPETISSTAATEQDLRLLNGTVARYVYGFFAMHPKTRQPFEPINEQWDWGAGWGYNLETGRLPTTLQLNRARLLSSLLLVGAMLSLYGLTRRIGGPIAALIAAAYFTLNPALLLNGRRAMMESSWLLFGLLSLYIAVGMCWRIQGTWPIPFGNHRRALRSVPLSGYVFLGGTLGLALASKHTALFYVAAVFGAVLFAPLLAKRRLWRIHAVGVPLMITVLIGMFLALNPAWWSDPIRRLGEVMHLRSVLLAGQSETFGGYASTGERLAGLLRQGFIVPAQYYEVANWKELIGAQIAAYEQSGLQGVSIGGSVAGALVVIGLVAVGVMACVRALINPDSVMVRPAEPEQTNFKIGRKEIVARSASEGIELERAAQADVDAAVPTPLPAMGAWVALWLGLAGLAAAVTTPLEWQRYYLPLYPAIAVFLGVGVMVIVRAVAKQRQGAVRQTPTDSL